MSSPDHDPQPEPATPPAAPAKAGGDHDDAAEQLLAVSEELGDTEQESGWRSRSGTVRRRQRVVRGATPQETEVRERVRVRTITEEGAVTGSPGPAAAPPEPEPAPVMLDAQGQPITEAAQAAATAATAATAASAALAGGAKADAGHFLADTVRSYLDGLDDLGADHPITEDRLAQLRRTLKRYERG